MSVGKLHLQDSHQDLLLVDRQHHNRVHSKLPAHFSLNPRIHFGILDFQNLLSCVARGDTQHCGNVASDIIGSTPASGAVNQFVAFEQSDRNSTGIADPYGMCRHHEHCSMKVELVTRDKPLHFDESREGTRVQAARLHGMRVC